ncbi:MAG TPA: hypothetical protein VFZ58_01625 [Candidatus Saccharimonadales bacterium]
MSRKKQPHYDRYRQPVKSCGKIQYAHKHEAEQAAEEAMLLRPEVKLRIYKCMNCGGWHLTRVRELENS